MPTSFNFASNSGQTRVCSRSYSSTDSFFILSLKAQRGMQLYRIPVESGDDKVFPKWRPAVRIAKRPGSGPVHASACGTRPRGAAHSTNGLWEDRVRPPPVSKCATAVTGEVPPGPRSIAELFAGGVPRLRGISGFPGRLNNWLVG